MTRLEFYKIRIAICASRDCARCPYYKNGGFSYCLTKAHKELSELEVTHIVFKKADERDKKTMCDAGFNKYVGVEVL